MKLARPLLFLTLAALTGCGDGVTDATVAVPVVVVGDVVYRAAGARVLTEAGAKRHVGVEDSGAEHAVVRRLVRCDPAVSAGGARPCGDLLTDGASNFLSPATVLYELVGVPPDQALLYFHGKGWSVVVADYRWQDGQ